MLENESPSRTEGVIPEPVDSAPSPEAADPETAEASLSVADGQIDHGEIAPEGDADGNEEIKSRGRHLAEWLVAIALALLAAFALKTFVVQAFVIPSESMRDTLLVDDRVLVSKLTYKFTDVGRGDLIVFDNPEPQPGQPAQLIKRVVAVGGDRIAVRDNQAILNGVPLAESYARIGSAGLDYEEQLIPENHVFVLGDNRGNSKDSRVFGPVAEGDIVGKAFLRIWPINRIGRL